jgi:hypothetical protein
MNLNSDLKKIIEDIATLKAVSDMMAVDLRIIKDSIGRFEQTCRTRHNGIIEKLITVETKQQSMLAPLGIAAMAFLTALATWVLEWLK